MPEEEGTAACRGAGLGDAVPPHGRPSKRGRSAPGTWWPPGDESGWEEYHRQRYDLAGARDGFSRWKIQSSGVNVARQLASARNRGLAAWVRRHGPDPDVWPLAHPPAVLWLPSVAQSACLRCWWLGEVSSSADAAAVAARRHALQRGAEDSSVKHLLDPLAVWQSYGGRDLQAPRTAG